MIEFLKSLISFNPYKPKKAGNAIFIIHKTIVAARILMSFSDMVPKTKIPTELLTPISERRIVGIEEDIKKKIGINQIKFI